MADVMTPHVVLAFVALVLIGYIALLVAHCRHMAKAEADQAELQRWRNVTNDYHHWLCEFDQVATVLENLQAEVRGDLQDASYPPGRQGPWHIQGLRETLRRRHAAALEAAQ